MESNRESMEELERSKFTAAGKPANEGPIEAATDPDRYPEGTAFIAADKEGFGAILAEAVADHRPLAIVYPDGREIVAAPRGVPWPSSSTCRHASGSTAFGPLAGGLPGSRPGVPGGV